jgi:hypothetical protein
MYVRRLSLGAVALVSLVTSAGAVKKAPTAEQLEQLNTAKRSLDQAADAYRTGKFTAAGDLVKQAQSLVSELAKSKQLEPQLASVRQRLRNAHTLLEIEGVRLPPLDPPDRKPRKQIARKSQKRAPPAGKRKRAAARPSKPQTATGNETIRFSRDIAAILVSNCFECHGQARQNRGRFSLATFAGLMRGGTSGVALKPGRPADSLIVKKLRGAAGARMPLDRDPLAEADIAKIEKWIAEKATFDGSDPNLPLDTVVASASAATAGHEKLAADRAVLARKNWRMALPDEPPAEHETKNFFLLGNIGQESLDALGKVAEQQAAAIAKMIRAGEGEPLVKGRITLLAFKRRSDYSEWRNVEGRELPADWRGHWKYNVVDAYACVVPPGGSEYGLAPLVAEQVGAIAVASLGQAPVWFADGAGRVIAARVDPRDARVRQWEERLAPSPSGRFTAEDFLAGKLPPEQQSLLNFALVKSLAANPQKYQGLLAQIRQGVAFDQAFVRIYGASPQAMLSPWTGRPAKTSPNVRRR